MDQLKNLLAALSIRQRIGIVAMAILVTGGMTGVVRWKHERDFRPLFTGMSAEDAAAIVQKVKESGTEYRIGDNGTSVLVPETKVNELRLQLAGAGLPKTGRVGFELFDKTNLGVTDFTEHVNYRRALEGELERSIKSLAELQQARVHITFPKESVFLDSREPAKASVLVDTRPGASLTAQNVLAITNLVASAVEGLNPDFVSVVDMQGNLLSRPRKSLFDENQPSDAALDYKHQVERDLVSKVESTLEPLLGRAKFRVGVSADCDFTTSEQSDESYDPTRSVMVSSQRSEDLSGTSETAGIPGTPSNTPRPAARPPATGSTVSRKTENVSYETTRTVRHVKTPQGAIKRISASVLLDQDVQWAGKGTAKQRVLVPPTPEKLKAIHDLVAGVLGLVPDRGDQLVIESLAFERTLARDYPEETPANPNEKRNAKPTIPLDQRTLIGAAAAVLIVLCAVFFLLRRKKKSVKVEQGPQALPASEFAESGLKKSIESTGAAALDQANADDPIRNTLQLPPPAIKKVEMLREHLKGSVKKDPAFAASILRGWLEEDTR
jgi:flagellar M-ring protein FliF